MDGCEYAVKKIILKYCDSELFAKIFREVTTLARLAHPNVVSYKERELDFTCNLVIPANQIQLL